MDDAMSDVAEQEQYLARTQDGVLQAGKLRVTRIEKRKITQTTTVGGIPIGHSEGTGKYESDVLRVVPQDARLADGRKGGGHVHLRVQRTAAGIKARVRRLRPEEAERLAVIDADIASLEQQILALRAARKDVVREAWSRAHVVRLSEIEALIAGAY